MRRQPVSPHSQETPTQHGLPPQPQEGATASASEAFQAAGNKAYSGRKAGPALLFSLSLRLLQSPGKRQAEQSGLTWAERGCLATSPARAGPRRRFAGAGKAGPTPAASEGARGKERRRASSFTAAARACRRYSADKSGGRPAGCVCAFAAAVSPGEGRVT